MYIQQQEEPMAKRLWIVLAALTVAALVSCQAPAVQKSRSKAKPKPKTAAVSTKAPAKPKTGAICPQPPPKATSSKQKPAPSKKAPAAKAPAQKKPAKAAVTLLPRLVDLGATKCVPCKMMAPILEELAKEYKGKLKVEFIDVWENRDAGGKYGIRVIPTQIFFDRKGKEFFRHEGFYPKEDILRKFKDQGIKLGK